MMSSVVNLDHFRQPIKLMDKHSYEAGIKDIARRIGSGEVSPDEGWKQILKLQNQYFFPMG